MGPRAPFWGFWGQRGANQRAGRESLVWLESLLWRNEPEASQSGASGALRGSYGALPVLACAVPGVGLIYEASRFGSSIARCGLASCPRASHLQRSKQSKRPRPWVSDGHNHHHDDDDRDDDHALLGKAWRRRADTTAEEGEDASAKALFDQSTVGESWRGISYARYSTVTMPLT